MSQDKLFYGIYRGTVTANDDPDKMGRIKAHVPSVYKGEETGWIRPCAPFAGKGIGFLFLPPVGYNVWISFEDGNKESPIWLGGFWEKKEAPQKASADVKIIKTNVVTMTFDDSSGSGGVTLETTSGLKIVMDSSGIELSNGNSKIKLTSGSVSVNDGALEVI